MPLTADLSPEGCDMVKLKMEKMEKMEGEWREVQVERVGN